MTRCSQCCTTLVDHHRIRTSFQRCTWLYYILILSSKYIQLSSLQNLDAHDQTCQGMLAIAPENSSPTLARPVWRETTWPPMHQTANAPSDAAIVASPEMYAKGSCCVNLLQDVKTCNCSNVIKIIRNHQISSNIIEYQYLSFYLAILHLSSNLKYCFQGERKNKHLKSLKQSKADGLHYGSHSGAILRVPHWSVWVTWLWLLKRWWSGEVQYQRIPTFNVTSFIHSR